MRIERSRAALKLVFTAAVWLSVQQLAHSFWAGLLAFSVAWLYLLVKLEEE